LDLFFLEAGKLFQQLRAEGIDPDSQESLKRQDVLNTEWGITIYHDQRQGIMDKYGLK